MSIFLQGHVTLVLGHKGLTLHKTTTLQTAGPKLPGEIAHSQSHGLTVEKCKGEGGEDGICEVEQRLHARTELPASRHMTSTLKVRENVLPFGNHCVRVSVKCGRQILLEVRLLLIIRNKLCINLMLLH